MKCSVFGFFAFLLALGFGTLVVWLLLTEHQADSPLAPQLTEIVVSEPISNPIAAEFRDLPNIDNDDSSPAIAQLVDVKEAENEYRKSEVIAKSGETWLGLFESNGTFELRREQIKVGLHHKSADPEHEDWFQFSFSRDKRPAFVIRNSNLLKAGPVVGLYDRPSPSDVADRGLTIKSMTRGYQGTFSLGNEKYTLRVTSGITQDGTEVNVLVLETRNLSQVVTYNTYFKDANTNYDDIGDLLWVGDLDRDGKLDLYLSEFGYEKGGFGSSLFLSSAAKNGALVKLIASFGTSGC